MVQKNPKLKSKFIGCTSWKGDVPDDPSFFSLADLVALANLDGGLRFQGKKNTGRLHTGIFDQNFFRSTIFSAPRMAGVSKEVRIHKKFVFVWLGLDE